MDSSENASRGSDGASVGAIVALGVVFLVCRGLLELPLAPWPRVVVSLIPVAPFAWFLRLVVCQSLVDG